MKFTEDDLFVIFDDLIKLEASFINEVKLFLQLGKYRNIHTMDLYTSAVINRSISLMRGFVTLAKENNYISSVPLIRIQLDNCLGFYAGTLVADPNDFFIKYLSGEHIRNLRDVSGSKMTDNYLVKKLEKVFPGIHKLYRNSSAHVHLSKEHSFLQTTIVADQEGTIETRIGNYDFYSIDKKVDYAFNMYKASEILLDLIRSWKFQKLKIEREIK